jgi:predicted Zn-dependent protease
MRFQKKAIDDFDRLSEACFDALGEGEQLTLNLAAEEQQFLRFNNSRVRQSTSVSQSRLNLCLQSPNRRVVYSFDLTGDLDHDMAASVSLIERGREELRELPEDPFVTPLINHGESQQHHAGRLTETQPLLEQVSTHTKGSDFTGLYAGGPQLRASCNSEGMRHAFSTESFFLDYSLFTVNAGDENKAVKALHAGREWDARTFEKSVTESRERLKLLKQDSQPLAPGHYRVFFAPAAAESLLALFSWGALSYRAWKKGDSALKRLIEGELQLSPLFSLSENFSLGLTPSFNSLGEVAPEQLEVIAKGALGSLLISSRTAQEYGVMSNGADSGEGFRSPEMGTGELEEADILSALNTGIYVSNLHYLNWSDLLNARITGMTRYACFWVENGEIIAPIKDLRFDESLYRVFGTELEAVTKTADITMKTDTYLQRSLGGSKVPGVLVRDFRFTL